jgi:hypothetical protein
MQRKRERVQLREAVPPPLTRYACAGLGSRMKLHGVIPFLVFSLIAGFPACAASDAGDPPCAPAPATESWPIDPTALMPRPWPDAGPFSPASHPPFPSLAAKGSGEITPLRLVSIVSAGDPLHDALFAFGDTLAHSQWLSSVADAYGLAPTGTNVHVDGPSLSGNVTVDDIRSYVEQAAAAQLGGPHAVYLLYLPPGATFVAQGNANCGCFALGGAHTTLDGKGNALAYVQRCSLSSNDSVTRIASHEIAEAITDTGPGFQLHQPSPPWSGTAWASVQPGGVESGDLCSGTYVTEGSWTYQRIWSNRAAATGGDPCVPSLSRPYFSASAPVDWVSVAAGATATIHVTGWSTGPRDDWYVYPLLSYPPSDAFSARVTTATQQTLDGVVYASINNGGNATLTVSVAPGTPTGTWTVVRLVSRSADLVDGTHLWPVGVYVP